MRSLGRVTALEPDPRRRRHVKVRIEDHDDLVLHEDVVVSLGLNVGVEVTDATLQQITVAEEASSAQQSALRLLKHRSRSRKELERSLVQKGFAQATIARTLEKLENMGYIDDGLFARDLARSLLRRHVGRQGLLYRLRQSGVSDEVAEEAVEELMESADDTERAVLALEKRLRKWDGLPQDKRRARAYQSLMRLGFSHDAIAGALRVALAGEDDE